jgi:uncharacterized protein YcfL
MRRIILAVCAVLLVAGCSSSRSYKFYPDSNQVDGKSPQNVGCGHVDLVIQDATNLERIEVGRFCPERQGG